MAGVNGAGIDQIVGRALALEPSDSRRMIAIAGPPGAGKSTLAEALVERLDRERPGQAVLMPMDGYHYDNMVLEARGLINRKGAPETFNAAGLLHDLARIRQGGGEFAVPVFDRNTELSRAHARIIGEHHELVVVEGNYLLLDQPVWREIAALFDLTVMIEVGMDELRRRLVDRWLNHGFDQAAAERRAEGNDLTNARLVVSSSLPADLVIANEASA